MYTFLLYLPMIKYQGLSTLEVLEEAKNYNRWIIEQFLSYIKSPLLEIGSGTGNISKFFANERNVTLSDIDDGLVKSLKKKFKKKNSLIVEKLDIVGNVRKKEIEKYQTIIAINVLEHITDDEKALINMHRMLKENGKILLLVPAKKIAYTRLDKSIGHVRRYEKEEMIRKLQKSGLIVEKIYFFNIVGLLSWIVRDKLERSHHMKPYQVILFDKIVPFVKMIESFVKPPIGVSLIAIATKVERQ